MRLKFYVSLSLLFCSFLFVNLAIGQPPVNLALGKTATSSSIENAGYTADHAFDGAGHDTEDGNAGDGKARNTGGVEYARWSSEYADPQWIMVDLGNRYEVNNVKLYWEVANGEDFRIEVSDDGSTWITVATVTGNSSTTFDNDIPISPAAAARFVRMYGTARTTGWGYSLYEFEVWGSNSILPIQLNDFSAQKKENSVMLSWNASMDAESRFNIQRSANGADFTNIGKLYYPTGTNGISNSYGYLDESPLAGVNYYRLEYTETGEKTLYSDVLSVRFAEKRSFNISPNPVTGNTIRVELDKTSQTKRTLRLLTITGKIIEQQEINANSSVADLQLNRQVSAGTYILQVLDGDQPVRSRKIIINR